MRISFLHNGQVQSALQDPPRYLTFCGLAVALRSVRLGDGCSGLDIRLRRRTRWLIGAGEASIGGKSTFETACWGQEEEILLHGDRGELGGLGGLMGGD